MREIKFRGKSVDSGEWVYGFYWFNSMSETHWLTLNERSTRGWNIEVIPETVGQYTEINDMNGVEIYEGDVVWGRAGEPRGELWEYEYEKRFVVDYGWSQVMWEMSMCEEIEVIGSIYDNPELLEG